MTVSRRFKTELSKELKRLRESKRTKEAKSRQQVATEDLQQARRGMLDDG